MKIYKVVNGEIEEIEVERETKFFYWLKECGPASYWLTRLSKTMAHTSKQDAVMATLNDSRIKEANLLNAVPHVEKEIKDLESLLMSLIGY